MLAKHAKYTHSETLTIFLLKINFQIEPKIIFRDYKYKIIYYGTNSINISDEKNTIDLSNALIKNQITLDDIIKNLETKNSANGKLYQNNTKNYQVLVCDNNNIFIGNKLSNLCK